jgi:hypothetical protein
MPLGPNKKSELELHWRHQQDHVRADIRNVYRRLAAQAEAEAFRVIAEAYNADGTLLDLRAEPGAIEGIAREAVKALPKGDA